MVHHVASTYGYELTTIAQLTRPQLRLLTRGAAEIGRIQKEVREEMLRDIKGGRGSRIASDKKGAGANNQNINPANVLSLLTMPGFEATPRLKEYIKKKAAQKRAAAEKNNDAN